MTITHKIGEVQFEVWSGIDEDLKIRTNTDEGFWEDLEKTLAVLVMKTSVGAMRCLNDDRAVAVKIFGNAVRSKEHVMRECTRRYNSVDYEMIRSGNYKRFIKKLQEDIKMENLTNVDIIASEEANAVSDVVENVEVKTVAEVSGTVEETVVEEENQYVAEYSVTLPEISEEDSTVVLASAEGFNVNMMVVADSTSKQIKGASFYLTDAVTGKAFINGDREIMIPKNRLMAATESTTLNCLNNFDINLSEDDRKIAFERAKTFIEIAKKKVDTSSSLCIEDAIIVVQEAAIRAAKVENENKELIAENRKFMLDEKKQTIAIRSEYMNQFLESLDIGYNKCKFGKKIRMYEMISRLDILHTNSDRRGFDVNTSINVRFFKMNIIQSNIKEVA